MNTRKTWNDKRYHSLDYYLKDKYGEKIYKLSLNAGMTCPNRDGTLGYRGCIFCSEGGSGDFASSKDLSITKQIEAAKELISNKVTSCKYIAYFQAYTNTYAPISYLRSIFYEAINHPDVVILSIATRPDCLSLEVLELIAKLNEIKPVWIELGLQTIHKKTELFIRRKYTLACFEEAVQKLSALHIPIIAHVILGLPNETFSDMLETGAYISKLPINGVKLQLLHILKNTDLASYYEENKFHILSLEEYTDIVIQILERMPDDIVIHRITGDGPKSLLIEPKWSLNKKLVLNHIQRQFKQKDTWQGKLV
ncbi:MAG: TIGR01212 family radical SAM protein [Candidatus Galacturonibacter soehngenii]|nr:TIGR01212 family radical SAM protein [Candidatus Galacturonibacter soehngenii]